MIIAGIGCRKGVSAAQVGDAIAAALARAGLQRDALHLIATPVFKGAEPGIVAAATMWEGAQKAADLSKEAA